MPVVRIPRTLAPLLELCRPACPPDARPIFGTYAELVTFCAAYGYHASEGSPSPCSDFLDRPNPIDLMVFKNQGLYPVLQVICLGTTKSTEVIEGDSRVVEMLEAFADQGASDLKDRTIGGTSGMEMLGIAELLLHGGSDDPKL